MGFLSGSVLLSMSMNALDMAESCLIQFAGDTEMQGLAKLLQDKSSIQKDLDKVENWARSNMDFNQVRTREEKANARVWSRAGW